MSIYVIDNYDSFTFNLVHYIEQYCDKIKVVRNDNIDIDEIDLYDKILISPGPGLPSETPILSLILKKYYNKKPIFGVCLGMQAIGEFFGSKLFNLPKIIHGVPEKTIVLKDDYLFNRVPNCFNSGRYHSWAIEKESLPSEIEIIATDNNNIPMAIAHSNYDIRAVQFHPESVMTEYGNIIVENWVKY